MEQVWKENLEVYGPRKVWQELKRKGYQVARCTVERRMRQLGSRGVTRGRRFKVTTLTGASSSRPADLVGRNFTV
ncbi:MAG: IS3 family transposase, partial [Candidatus Handelsmanbacteria bacterium]|nr:IS3 family transposase [Candidatus Handelsmanbacteria bacterium]